MPKGKRRYCLKFQTKYKNRDKYTQNCISHSWAPGNHVPICVYRKQISLIDSHFWKASRLIKMTIVVDCIHILSGSAHAWYVLLFITQTDLVMTCRKAIKISPKLLLAIYQCYNRTMLKWHRTYIRAYRNEALNFFFFCFSFENEKR